MKNKPFLRFTAIFAAALFAAAIMVLACFAAESDNYKRHTVASGETLSVIAKKYGVALDEITRLNNIGDVNFITAGTVLKIPVAATEVKSEPVAATEVKSAPVTEAVTQAPVAAAPEVTKLSAQKTAASAPPAAPQNTGAGAAASASEKPSEGYGTMLTSFDTKVSVAFVDTDLRDALSAFALNMGYNIIYKGGPQKITMTMKDVTMGEALDYLMRLTNLDYIIIDNTIIVGAKSDLTTSFNEAVKLTEFTLTYVSAQKILEQLSTFNIPVDATLSGGSDYRFIAQGLPADLARVRDLIAMVDRRENATGGGTSQASTFYSIELTNITAAEFQRILSAAALPSGVILASRPNTLYIFALPSEYSSIKSIKSIVDVATADTSSANKEKIVAKTLKYITVELIESQIKANANVTIIKISTNHTKMWLKGYAAGIADAENIIALLDIAENAAATEVQLIDKFTPIATQFISAARFKDTLSKLAVKAITVVYEQNPKTLYVYATDDNLALIKNLLTVIDVASNADATAEEVLALFRPVTCTYISAAQLNGVLKEMALPTGIIFAENPKTLYIYVSDTDLAQIKDLLNVIDIKANENVELSSGIKSVKCRYITAAQLNSMLEGMSLPTGMFFAYNPNVLYLNVNDAQLQEICEVAAYIDTLENSKAGADSFNIYLITLYYTNTDKAIEFINQIGLELNVIKLSNSQKKLWVMGEYSEYIKAKSAISAIDVPNATLNASVETFTLKYITAGEAKKLIDNAKLTGVLVYIPNGHENGSQIYVYFPSDSFGDIVNFINKIDSDQTTYTLFIERIATDVYSTPDDPGLTKLIAHINLIARLSGVPAEKFVWETDYNEAGKECYMIYLKGATMLECNKVSDIMAQIG